MVITCLAQTMDMVRTTRRDTKKITAVRMDSTLMEDNQATKVSEESSFCVCLCEFLFHGSKYQLMK